MTMQDWHAAKKAKIEAKVAAEKAAAAAEVAAVADRKYLQALARAASIKERLERKREAAWWQSEKGKQERRSRATEKTKAELRKAWTCSIQNTLRWL